MGITSIDIVVPSIRHDPREMLKSMRVRIPAGTRAAWFVVSDNPSVASAEFTHEGSPVRVIRNEKKLGAPLSRNVGLEAGTGEYVLFLDDDVEPAPDILERYADAVRDDPDAAGYVGPTFFPDPVNSFTRGIRASGYLFAFEDAPSGSPPVSWGTTSNILFSRKRIGGTRFSGVFPAAGGGEDIDFCLNIAGGPVMFRTVPEASVRHGWWGGGRRSYRRFFRWAFGDSRLTRMHPKYAYRDFPNTPEMLLFGTCAAAALALLPGISWALPAAWAGIVAACDLGAEQARTRIQRGRIMPAGGIEAAAIRLSSDLGRIAGPVSRREAPSFLARFDYLGTGGYVRFERMISGAKFAASMILAAAWAAASYTLTGSP